ncbi:MAG TPA: thermonuclease family protein [Terriglobales bacterium]|jgi:endonuclease YncB( thermonuclease family)|nr:thermonuclease family protein [Terriglobales bacterium]
MRNKRIMQCVVACLVMLTGLLPVFAGDSLYGKVTEVRSADVVVLDYGAGSYVIRVMGIVVPAEGPIANESKQFVSKLVQGKNARMRLGSRTENGEMVARLYTDDPVNGIKDVGLELVRSGLARRSQGEDYQFDYKYNELSTAEREARESKRGLWATAQPQ